MTAEIALAALVAMIAARAGRQLRSSPRSPLPHASAQSRRSRSYSTDYAALLDGIARQVRSGSTLTGAAMDEIDRASPLGLVLNGLDSGTSLEHALATIVTDDGDLALAVQALSATAHLGGPVAATLDEAAAVLRERVAARAERLAHGSQARLSARVLTIVPVAFALWSVAASQSTRNVYVSTAAGGLCAICGLALNFAGWRWMKRIIGPS